jgi:CBS domain containing-hemolysin-like protein
MLVLLMLEFLVDRLPLQEPEKWSLALNGAASALDVLMTPLAFPLASLQGSNGGTQSNNYPMTEDELKNWMETEQSEGGLEEDERRMIYSIFQFGDTLCREIMVPRIDVHALEVTTPVGQAMDEMIRSGHSRVPVYEESIDNVLGLLYAKDLLKIRSDGNADLRKLIRPAYFVPESKKVDDLLAEMQRRGVHMAVVVDEYGGMAGLVTLEDIVEEIVGEIRDEYDTSEEPAIHQVSEDEYHFKGQVSLDDVNEVLNINLVAENSDSLGGFIYGQLGRVPLEGDRVQMGDWDFKVEEVRNRRIIKICAERSGHHMQEESNDFGSISASKTD